MPKHTKASIAQAIINDAIVQHLRKVCLKLLTQNNEDTGYCQYTENWTDELSRDHIASNLTIDRNEISINTVQHLRMTFCGKLKKPPTAPASGGVDIDALKTMFEGVDTKIAQVQAVIAILDANHRNTIAYVADLNKRFGEVIDAIKIYTRGGCDCDRLKITRTALRPVFPQEYPAAKS